MIDELFEYGVYLALLVALAIPLSAYLNKVMAGQKTVLSRVLVPVENAVYRCIRVDKSEDMGWKRYLVSAFAFSAICLVGLFAILMLQGLLPLNPEGIPGMSWDLAFNTAVSFVTNTNWQAYSGESALSYFSQAIGLTVQNFVTPAVGLGVLFALFRGIVSEGNPGLGNFWVDVTRAVLFVLIPLSLVVTMIDVQQGSPQNFNEYETVQLLEPVGVTADGSIVDADDPAAVETIDQATVPMGPQASQVAIKQLGTNGGGFLGANSTTPLENPTIISDITELLSMMILPGACVIMFGLMYHNRKKLTDEAHPVVGRRLTDRQPIFGGEGRTVFVAMGIIFVVGLCLCYFSELAGNPKLAEIGLSQSMGSMEGKEVRFGIAQSALFTTVTTSFTTGTVNNMHDTLTPLGGMVPLLHMMLNCVFGGKGVGLMNMIMYVMLGVFLCGLMIGRTPEYLGKKVEGREMKMAVLVLIIHPLLILGFSALAVGTEAGRAGITNPGFHGLSQVLYEYSSSAANNGSGFEGLADNTYFWNITAGLAMFFGRYLAIVLQLAIAWSLLCKKRMNESIGTLKTNNIGFGVIVAFVVYIFAALTFFPALALGPIAEHLSIWLPV